MRSIREELEAREGQLDPQAARSVNATRLRREKRSPVRTEFQRDRDRILHSKAFRRLIHKTQVFFAPRGDHYRTRLTHTLELSQIARTIAKALALNEDLTEAIALGHDLGHTPFGHTGEAVLDEISPQGFRHFEQSLRVVDRLENNGAGLNLTLEVRDGIAKHSKGKGPVIPADRSLLPLTLEGQIVRLADIIAYVNHDIDDALRARVIGSDDIPASAQRRLGTTFAKRIDTIVIDAIMESKRANLEYITLSPDVYEEILNLRVFLYELVYLRDDRQGDKQKIRDILMTIFDHVRKTPGDYVHPYPDEDALDLRVIDFIAGMTDRYALDLFREIVFPRYSV